MRKENLDRIRAYYKKGLYKKAQIDAMHAAGKITAAEYAYVTGDEA